MDRYSATLIIVDASLSGLRGSGASPTSAVAKHLAHTLVAGPAGELNVILQLELDSKALRVGQRMAGAEKHRAPVGPSLAQERERPQSVVDTVLRCDDAYIGQQVLTSLLQSQVRAGGLEADRIGGVPNNEHVFRGFPTALDGDSAIGLVRRDDDVGNAEAGPLEYKEGAIDGVPAAAEAREIELWRKVVVVEDEAGAAPLQRPHHREEEIRWVRGVDNVERPLIVQPERKPARVPARRCVFAEISKGSALRCSKVVAVDVDALESNEDVTVTVVAARADHGDVVSSPPKRETLLPDSPVRRNGEILHKHEHPRRVAAPAFAAVLPCRRHRGRILRGGAPQSLIASPGSRIASSTRRKRRERRGD